MENNGANENVSTGYIRGMCFPPEDGRLIFLTASQCRNVAEFIEIHLIDAIRNDVDLDNVGWIEDMIVAMRMLEEAAKKDGEAE